MRYPGSIENDEEVGKTFEIIGNKESLQSVGVYEGEDIVDLKGELLCQYSMGLCLLSVKRKYTEMDNVIINTTVLLPKTLLKKLVE